MALTPLLLAPLAVGLVVADANVLTLDKARPHAHDLAIVDGRIAYVGDDLAAARAAAGAGAKQLDAHGATVMPGFNDAHVHFGLSLTLGAEAAIDLGDGAPDRATFARTIVEAAKRPIAPDGHDWIMVITRGLPAGVRNGADLPRVARPLFVVTERGGILNERARIRLGLSAEETPLGQVRGRLLPAALDRVVKSLPREVLLSGARRFLAEAARLGLTSLQLMDELPDIFDTLRRAGELTARIRMMVFGYRFETPRYVPTWRSPDPDMLRVDALKYFHDDWARLPRAELAQLYAESRVAKRPVVLHVLSRGALRSLLTELEHLEAASPGGARLFRIDHADDIPPELADRIHKLGMMVCSNPAMLPEWRSDHAFPMRTLIDHGVATCIGSDYIGKHQPARPLAPLAGVQLAVTHGGYGDRERIGVDEALRAFTQGSALAEGRSDLGIIEVGAAADLVGLGGDPTSVPPTQIAELPVRFTIVAGRVVYERSLEEPARAPTPAPPNK